MHEGSIQADPMASHTPNQDGVREDIGRCASLGSVALMRPLGVADTQKTCQ